MLTWLNCSLILVFFEIPFPFCLVSIQGSSDFCINPDAYVSKVVEDNAVLSAGKCWVWLWHRELWLQLSRRSVTVSENLWLCLEPSNLRTVGKADVCGTLENQCSSPKKSIYTPVKSPYVHFIYLFLSKKRIESLFHLGPKMEITDMVEQQKSLDYFL